MQTSTVAVPENAVERWIHQWLAYWHGSGHTTQFQFYRCRECHRLVTWKIIREGGCPCAMGNRVSPAVLTRWEKFRLVVLPWTL